MKDQFRKKKNQDKFEPRSISSCDRLGEGGSKKQGTSYCLSETLPVMSLTEAINLANQQGGLEG